MQRTIRSLALLALILAACSPPVNPSPSATPSALPLPPSPTISPTQILATPTIWPTPTPLPEYYDSNCQYTAGNRHTWGVYMVSVFGENLTRLTTEDANYRYPQFSSDGRYLAFVRICEPSGALVFYDPRSKELRVISEKSGGYGAPVWSPDSNRLAFTRFLGGKTELILYELGDQRLTTIANWAGKVGSLTWSPTGKQLAFAGATGNGYEVYAINADGTRPAPKNTPTPGSEQIQATPPGITASGGGTQSYHPAAWATRLDGRMRVFVTRKQMPSGDSTGTEPYAPAAQYRHR